jgi:acyl-CoA reductase-like NAD-dependent aldehyde dehydrogenase
MQTQAFIGGQWIDSEIGKKFPVSDPVSGKLIAEVADCGSKFATFAIEAAYDAFPAWSKKTAKERSEILQKIKTLMVNNLEELAHLLSLENVK